MTCPRTVYPMERFGMRLLIRRTPGAPLDAVRQAERLAMGLLDQGVSASWALFQARSFLRRLARHRPHSPSGDNAA